MKRFAIACCLLVMATACGPSVELKQLVRDQASNSNADLKDYRANRLTTVQVDEKFFDDACSWAALNYSVNGVAIPPEYAPVKTDSKTSAPK